MAVIHESTPLSELDLSPIDIVLGGTRDLRKTLPVSDQRTLDDYLDSVRSVERRIAAIEARQKEAALEKAGVPNAGPSASRRSRLRSLRLRRDEHIGNEEGHNGEPRGVTAEGYSQRSNQSYGNPLPPRSPNEA